MKKLFVTPLLEVIAFTYEDVITTSGVGEKPIDDNDGSFSDWVTPTV